MRLPDRPTAARARTPGGWRRAALALFFLTTAAQAAPVAASKEAATPEFSLETSLQYYELTNPSGRVVLPRRRFVSTVGVASYGLLGAQAPTWTGELSFRARLRVDGDLGIGGAERNPALTQAYVPGLQQAPTDLMYAYVEGRRWLGGVVGFRLGRQYRYDALGYWSFDGGSLRLQGPVGLALETYGGLENRGGLPLSTPRFERDGVWRGNRSGLDLDAWAGYGAARVAPAYGANLEFAPFPALRSVLGYRRVHSTDTVRTDLYGSAAGATRVEGARLSQERLAAMADLTLGSLGSLRAGAVYDMLLTAPTSVYGTLDFFTSESVTLSADYDWLRPSFDGDSIWNYFVAYPSYDTGLRVSFTPDPHWSLSAGSHARALFETSLDAEPTAGVLPDTTTRWNGGGHLAARYAYDTGRYGARAEATSGPEGHRVGADVFAERTLDGRYLFSGRLSLYDFANAARPDRSATSFGMVGGVGYLLGPRARTMIEIEQNVSQTYGQRIRAMASFAWTVF